MKDVYIVSAVRTPVGKNKGYLRNYMVPELLAAVLDEVVRRIDLDPALIDEVINGTVYQIGEQGFTLGRTGVLATESFPTTVPGISVNEQCGSSLRAIQLAYGQIVSGVLDIVIASGCECLSKYTLGSDMNCTLSNGKPAGHPWSEKYIKRFGVPSQMEAASKIAEKWGVTREECEDFAISSHQKAHHATVNGYFKNEIMPMKGVDKDGNEITMYNDETIRPETNKEILRGLKVLPKTNWLTAGLSSTVTDGASAVVMMSGQRMKELNLKPIARIVESAVVGADPALMLTGPLYVTPKVLKKAGLKMDDIDIFEINEAFAPIPLAWVHELKADMGKLNVNGGAMALGHPVGNSGVRLTVTAINELQRRKAKYALVSLCTGGGMAPATIFERA